MGNICKERFQCKGACCQTPHITFKNQKQLDAFLAEIQRQHPETKIMPQTEWNAFCLIQAIASPNSNKVIAIAPDKHTIQISGTCPFLSEEGDCSIHDKPYYPKACSNLKPGSNDCNRARNILNLPPIN